MSLKYPVTPPGIDPGIRIVAQRLNHYATPGPDFLHAMCMKYEQMPVFNISFIVDTEGFLSSVACIGV